LNPEGTFKGYGAYVGIEPHRQLPVGASAIQIGRLVVQLLKKSGPTGFHIEDHALYSAQATDGTSKAVLEWARPARATTSLMARRFLGGVVRTTDRLKSWRVMVYEYDSRLRANTARDAGRLVSKGLGAEALGEAVRAAFPI
jgi:hypothetical protein